MSHHLFSSGAAASILRLAWPTALTRLGVMAMSVTDTIMVGQLAPQSLPALALGNALVAVFLVAAFGLLTGVQVWTARLMGEGRLDAAGGVWRRGVALALLAGGGAIPILWLGGEALLVVFGVGPTLAAPAGAVMAVLAISLPLHLVYVATSLFLEAIRRPTAALVVMWGANLLNLGLNAALIPELGAVGSAWATVASRAFLAAVLVVYLLSLRDAKALGLRGVGQACAPVKTGALLSVGVAAAISQAAEAGAFSAMTVIAGRLSAEAVAAYAILLNLLALAFMVAMGMATATAVTVSEAIGRQDRRAAAAAAWTGLALNGVAMAVIFGIFLLAAGPIARAFTSDVALGALVVANMAWAAAILIPDGGQFVVGSALRARGDNWASTASHIFAYVFVMPPLAYVLAERMGQGVAGLLAAIFWASIVSVAVLGVRQSILIRRG